jgi:heme/copper-type cytochrome/quinol oxidase subunit 1
VLRRIFSTNHKVIGLQYGFTSLFFLLFGFSLAMHGTTIVFLINP